MSLWSNDEPMVSRQPSESLGQHSSLGVASDPETKDAIPYLGDPGTPWGEETTGTRADSQRGHREVEEAVLSHCWGCSSRLALNASFKRRQGATTGSRAGQCCEGI